MNERAFTRWYPDTCGCVIDYYNDDQSFRSTVEACDKHAGGQNSATHFADVAAHNRAKNAVVNYLAAEHGLDPVSVAVGYDRSASADNDPIIVQHLPVNDKGRIAAALLAKYGADKIKVA